MNQLYAPLPSPHTKTQILNFSQVVTLQRLQCAPHHPTQELGLLVKSWLRGPRGVKKQCVTITSGFLSFTLLTKPFSLGRPQTSFHRSLRSSELSAPAAPARPRTLARDVLAVDARVLVPTEPACWPGAPDVRGSGRPAFGAPNHGCS